MKENNVNEMAVVPTMYDRVQIEEMELLIEQEFGELCEGVFHEKVSEYVHVDTSVANDEEAYAKWFVTCGMGARTMESPFGDVRCELAAKVSDEVEPMSERSAMLASELARIARFPFREHTWIGSGHTMNTHQEFRETFGYEYVAFADTGIEMPLSSLDEAVTVLKLVPLYEEEREWCVQNNTYAFLAALYEAYGEAMFFVDKRRDMFIPEMDEEEIERYNLMWALGLDGESFDRLCNFLVEKEEENIEVTREMVDEWLAQHR